MQTPVRRDVAITKPSKDFAHSSDGLGDSTTFSAAMRGGASSARQMNYRCLSNSKHAGSGTQEDDIFPICFREYR